MVKLYTKSEQLLARAEKSIPLGTQTFSKSKTQFPYGVSPYFIERGEGSHVWDVDGNEYIDFINGLAAITLGYNDPDVNAAVQAQLAKGTIFSLAHPIEVEVAEKIIEMVPCAEKVRFGKNGSDATSGCIRLARAHTGREHVLVCGYHGWQDWYIGSTARHIGVPECTRELTHTFDFNDIESLKTKLEELSGKVAAVILEPMNVNFPHEGFLEKVKELTHEHGALLIFDEVVTGFRHANGGAQEYFGVIPDLVALGKGLSNGYPLSAIAGPAKIMDLLEEVYFSFTYGGETLSLAAALAAMTKLQTQDVIKEISIKGARLNDSVRGLIKENGLEEIMSVSGHPTWSFLQIKDHEKYDMFTIKTFFMQEMMDNGILTLGSHLLSYAHSDEDIDAFIASYASFLSKLKKGLNDNTLLDMLRCEPLRPLFKVRKGT
jgi:glutamate-1-semialdehyde 2,1-aminomutase|tara:strand:+ start:227306 stop:228604 length:1299 start_codon:yes stop_codon:yes gene_type:complete